MAREEIDAKIIPLDESRSILEEFQKELCTFKEMGNGGISGQLLAILSICRELEGWEKEICFCKACTETKQEKNKCEMTTKKKPP